MLERAAQLNIPNRWLRFEDLASLEHPPNDNWHFARSSASELQRLLNDMLDPRFFGLPATYGAHRPPPPRPTPTVRRPQHCQPSKPEGSVPKRNKIDAAVQTEPLQLRPVAATAEDAVAQT